MVKGVFGWFVVKNVDMVKGTVMVKDILTRGKAFFEGVRVVGFFGKDIMVNFVDLVVIILLEDSLVVIWLKGFKAVQGVFWQMVKGCFDPKVIILFKSCFVVHGDHLLAFG